jgi:hypothetical protein
MSRLVGGIRQLGMVVRDADAAMLQWSSVFGIGPFIPARNIVFEDYRYRGRRVDPPIVTLCIAQSGPLQIEIIQQHNEAPSAYTEFLATGREGSQHVATWFSAHDEYDLAYKTLIGNGLTVVHEARLSAIDCRFAYFDGGVPGGMMIEIAESLLQDIAPMMAKLNEAAEGWDGTDPIRSPESLFT